MMQKWMTVLDLILLDVLSGGSLVWLMSNWAKGVKISDEKHKSVVERSD